MQNRIYLYWSTRAGSIFDWSRAILYGCVGWRVAGGVAWRDARKEGSNVVREAIDASVVLIIGDAWWLHTGV